MILLDWFSALISALVSSSVNTHKDKLLKAIFKCHFQTSFSNANYNDIFKHVSDLTSSYKGEEYMYAMNSNVLTLIG